MNTTDTAKIALARRYAFDAEDLDLMLEGWGHLDLVEMGHQLRKNFGKGRRRR